MKLTTGTRASLLAVRQAEIVVQMIAVVRPDLPVVVRKYETSGDIARSVPIEQLDPSAFTDRLEQALLANEIDIAVHSYKDLPPSQPEGLLIGAVPLRADPREALVSRDGFRFAELPAGATVGVSSERRASAISAMRPDLVLRPIRGAVDARIAKVRRGDYDATIVAVAGLERLGLMSCVSEIFDMSTFPSAPGQGALAVQCRRDDAFARGVLREIDDPDLHAIVDSERLAVAGSAT